MAGLGEGFPFGGLHFNSGNDMIFEGSFTREKKLFTDSGMVFCADLLSGDIECDSFDLRHAQKFELHAGSWGWVGAI